MGCIGMKFYKYRFDPMACGGLGELFPKRLADV